MIIICIIIFYIVYLKIHENIHKKVKKEKEEEPVEIEEEEEKEEFQNNIVSNKKNEFDPYTFYKHTSKEREILKNKLDVDLDYDYDDIDDIDDKKYFKETFDQSPILDELVSDNIEPNFIFSMPFPENTSNELPVFTAEDVVNKYDASNMGDLYNTINADMYRGYKTLKYML